MFTPLFLPSNFHFPTSSVNRRRKTFLSSPPFFDDERDGGEGKLTYAPIRRSRLKNMQMLSQNPAFPSKREREREFSLSDTNNTCRVFPPALFLAVKKIGRGARERETHNK